VESRAIEFHGHCELGYRRVEADRAERQGDRVLLDEAWHARGLQDLADTPDLQFALTPLRDQVDQGPQLASSQQGRTAGFLGAEFGHGQPSVPE